jgi:hypothetical protein
MATAFYDGQALFGLAVRVMVVDNPTAAQVASFFGVTGQVSLFGGSRGRAFEISGVLVAPDLPTLNTMEALIRSYDDGIARAFVDTKGVAWPGVVYRLYRPSGPWLWGAGGLICQPYKALFQGLL